MICVIDYGMGNLRSVSKAIEALGGRVQVSSNPKTISHASKLILPGVGEFGTAMKELKSRRIEEPIQEAVRRGKPFLGICLGLQLLFEESDESPNTKGLSIIPGKVKKFKLSKTKNLKIPQMGWNQVDFAKSSPITKGIQNHSFFYFVHSYYALPQKKDVVLGTTEYGEDFPSIIGRDSIFALQFHPEKSQSAGLKILKNFIQY